MNPFLNLFSRIPNVKGKHWLGQKVISHFFSDERTIQKTKWGFSMHLNLGDRLQRRILIRRDHEPETEIVLNRFFKKADCFIDIGANIGYYSLLAKATNSKIAFRAFELLPVNMEQLKKSAALNHFSDIEFIEKCLGAHPGNTEFLVPPADECGWGRMAYKNLFDGEKIQRQITTLDQNESLFKAKTVIKMDVEGFERDVLMGGSNAIQKWKPVLCIEMNEPCFKDLGFTSQDVFNDLKGWGYQIYAIKDNGNLEAIETPIENYAAMNYVAISRDKTSEWL